MLTSSSTKKTNETSKTGKDVLLENSSLTNDKHSKEDQTISDVEKEYSRASSITADTMLVIVQNLDGTFFTLNVNPSDSITKVKEMIKAKKGIDAYKYYLVFNDKELEDEKSVSDYDIKHESFIQMLPFVSRNIQFLVQNNAGNNIWISVGENESVKNLKLNIQNECKIPLDQQRFTCFDENTLLNGNYGMEEICDGIKEVREDIAEIKSALEKNFGAIENEFDALEIESAGTSDVNNQDNVFDGHENYQRGENETPTDSDSENTASSFVEEGSENDKDLIDESEEPDPNKSRLFTTDDKSRYYDFPWNDDYYCKKRNPRKSRIIKDKSRIIKPPNYQFLKREWRGKMLDRLMVFASYDKKQCYEYNWSESSKRYVCTSCTGSYKYFVSAKVMQNQDGEEFIQLGLNNHKCNAKEFLP